VGLDCRRNVDASFSLYGAQDLNLILSALGVALPDYADTPFVADSLLTPLLHTTIGVSRAVLCRFLIAGTKKPALLLVVSHYCLSATTIRPYFTKSES
jgi:hypothetical protein